MIGASSKFGTGSGNCAKAEGENIRIGIPKRSREGRSTSPGNDYVIKSGTRRGPLLSDVAPIRHRGPYTGVPLSGRLARHIPRES